MPAILEESTITAKGQTTVPKTVRQALGVQTGDRIVFRVDEGGVITVLRAFHGAEDPALGPFLGFLAHDIKQRPEALRALTPALAARIAELTRGVEVDLDTPIDGAVAI
jgi:antitoxin PrlF